MPLVVVVGLAIGHATQHSGTSPTDASTAVGLPGITVSAPPSNAATQAPCTALLEQLPVTDVGLHSRPALSTSPFVVAWGQPPVVLRCGVARPAALVVASTAQVFEVDGVNYLEKIVGKTVVYTAIDRAAYVEVTIPKVFAAGPLPAISNAIAAAMPAVCVVDPNETDPSKLCTHRPS